MAIYLDMVELLAGVTMESKMNKVKMIRQIIRNMFPNKDHKLAIIESYRHTFLFHYTSYSTRPDTVSIYLTAHDREPYLTWDWIAGKDAAPQSFLGRLHAMYIESKEEESINTRKRLACLK